VRQRNDQVFQLSLTEIAFTILFLLLILLGYMIFKEETARVAAETALAQVQTTEQAASALSKAKESLGALLKERGAANQDSVISKLISAENLRAERDHLKQEVKDLDAKLTALTELQGKIEKAAQSDRFAIVKENVDSALALQEQVREAMKQERAGEEKKNQEPPPKPALISVAKVSAGTSSLAKDGSGDALNFVRRSIAVSGEFKKQLKNQLAKELEPGEETQTVADVVNAAKRFGDLAKTSASPETLKKENSDLRGQVAFLKNRLDARGGRDFPPCWADENGKVEFLFSLDMKPDSVAVVPAWPARRETAALALPGVGEALAGAHSYVEFVKSIQGIFNWSKKQSPECRHYVQLKSSISDAVQSDRARLMVESYFYKVEARR
jgi:hypothetical protein